MGLPLDLEYVMAKGRTLGISEEQIAEALSWSGAVVRNPWATRGERRLYIQEARRRGMPDWQIAQQLGITDKGVKNIAEYYNKTELKGLGWTQGAIRSFLGDADLLSQHPDYPKTRIKYWRVARVEQAQESDEFNAWLINRAEQLIRRRG